MSTLKDLTDTLTKLQACIDSDPGGTVTQAQLDSAVAQAQAALAACEAKHPPVAPVPVVNAGVDQSVINQPESVTLTGTISPTGGNGTFRWSQVSGPGSVTFSNPTNLITTATFSATGVYVLRLTYTDGSIDSNDITVTVN